MKKSCRAFILLGIIFAAGCSTVNWPGYEPVDVPLSAGVRDTAFLTSGELEIVHDMIKARSKTGDGTLQPLRLSKGLSSAAKQRAVELADRSRKEGASGPEALMARVRKFGKVKGRVAEFVSHGFPPRVVVGELMKENKVTEGGRPDVYFLDPEYTITGVGCSGDFYPICVLMFAMEFEEE